MLRQKAIKAVKWTSLSAAVKGAVHFLQYALLAHYVTPAEFGAFGIVMLVVGFGQMYTDGGMANAIIHFQDMSREQLSTLYWFNIALGALLYSAILAGAPLAARFFRTEGIVPLCDFAGLVFLIIPLGAQFQALLQKDLSFDLLAKIHILSTLAGGAAAILSAVAGAGVNSLVIGLITGTVVRTIQLMVCGIGRFRPKACFSLQGIGPILRFSLYQLGQKSVGFAGSRADQLIIGKLIGVTDLGYYNLAYNLVILPVQGINPIITRVAFPVYARIHNEGGKLVKGYSEMLKLLALLNFPVFFAMMVFAEPIIASFYGGQWLPSAELVKVLGFVGIICSLSNPLGSILLAKGRADLSFKWDVFVCCLSLAAVFIGSRFNVLAVSWSLVAAYAVFFFLEYFLLLEPVIGDFKGAYFVGGFLVPVSYSAAAGAAMLAFRHLAGSGGGVMLLFGVGLGAIVYLLCIIRFERPLLRRYFGRYLSVLGLG